MPKTLTTRYHMRDLFPPRTAWVPRSSPDQVAWVFAERSRLDSACSHAMPVMGTMPLITHVGTQTAPIRRAYDVAALPWPEQPVVYRDDDDLIPALRRLRADGYRLGSIYPLPTAYGEDGALVANATYAWLNDKANLPALVDVAHLPASMLADPGDATWIDRFRPDTPVFVKACTAGASGAGFDVRFCADRTARIAAHDDLTSGHGPLTGLRIEEAVDVDHDWCVNLVVTADDVWYLGAATQVFDQPGKQSGSRIDPDDQPDAAVIDVAMASAHAGRARGFVGPVGFDVGRTADGRIVVFDLNFRIAACTPIILMHDAVTGRTGTRVSQLFACYVDGPIGPGLRAVEPFMADGRFIPVRLWDCEPSPFTKSLISGTVVGHDIADADAVARAIRAALDDLS